MTNNATISTKMRILDAAIEHTAAHPAEDMPLRAVCQRANVQLPTLYHHFGSKKGLLIAVKQSGFEKLMDHMRNLQNNLDFFDNVRNGWNGHIHFGMKNPGLYILMYGQLEPSSIDISSRGPEEHAAQLCSLAQDKGLLSVTAERAAAHIMCNCIGATLRFIGYGQVDEILSRDIREATLAAISATPSEQITPHTSSTARELLRALSTEKCELAEPELGLLRFWLLQL